jgi:hypothetical protein
VDDSDAGTLFLWARFALLIYYFTGGYAIAQYSRLNKRLSNAKRKLNNAERKLTNAECS